MTKKTPLTQREIELLQHTLGADSRYKKRQWGFRNYYNFSEGTSEHQLLKKLEGEGLTKQTSPEYFKVTRAGAQAIGFNSQQLINAGLGQLILPVKQKWFEQIKEGIKKEEYRLNNQYWQKRLINKRFESVIVTLGYPNRDDAEKRIIRPWRGYAYDTVISEEWDNEPKECFAIHINNAKQMPVSNEFINQRFNKVD